MLWFYILSALFQCALIATESYHHSTMGEFYVEWRALGLCPKEKRGTDEISIDIRISKRNRKPELVGNYTYKVDFDDSLSAKCNFAVLGSNLAWLPNALTLTFPRVCSGFSNAMGPTTWIELTKSMNMSAKCPTPKGTYECKGFDVNKIMRNAAFPKQFIYGRYKTTVEFFNKKDVLIGCAYFVVDVLPLWQKKKPPQSNTYS